MNDPRLEIGIACTKVFSTALHFTTLSSLHPLSAAYKTLKFFFFDFCIASGELSIVSGTWLRFNILLGKPGMMSRWMHDDMKRWYDEI
jgi:hypothetical protein